MGYTVHQAKTHFSRLLKEAEAGKEVIVTRGKKPVAKIVRIEQPADERLPFRLLGAFRGKIRWDESALGPMSDKELVEYGFDSMLDGDLVSPPEAK
jgi:prevent-host-death family protein